MTRCRDHDPYATRRAEYLVCGYLVQACQQAIYELALDDGEEPEVRRQAIDSLREILTDWREARKAIRSDLGTQRRLLRPVNGR
jgi:hypothetical protein